MQLMNLISKPFAHPRTYLRYGLVLLAAFMLGACQRGEEASAPVTDAMAWVDGKPVTAAMVDRYLALRGQRGVNAAQRQAALQELIRVQAVVNRAADAGLADAPEVAAELALSRQQILLSHFTTEYVKQRPVTEEELRKAYNLTVKRSGQQQVRLESILYTDEQSAVATLLAMEEGRPFDDYLAQARTAGLVVETLEWVDLSQFPEDYATVVVDVKAGQVVPVPLRDTNGWRVFRLLERRRYQPPAFAEIRTGLEQELRRQALQEWSERLLSQAEVKMAEDAK